MSEFKALFKADIDTSQLESKVQKVKINSPLYLTKFKLDTIQLPSQIQASLDKHKFTISLDKIKTNDISTQTRNLSQKISKSVSDSIKFDYDTKKFEASLTSVEAKFKKLGGSSNSSLQGMEAELKSLRVLMDDLGDTSDVTKQAKAYDDFTKRLATAKNTLSAVAAEGKGAISALQMNQLDNKMATWLNKNSRATKDYGAEIDSLRTKLKELYSAGDLNVGNYNSITKEFDSIVLKATQAGKVGKSMTSTFKDALGSISKYISVSTLIASAVNGLKDMYQNIYNIDTAMTELKKVTDETASSYSNFLQSAKGTAKEIGTTVADLVNSTADFARLGYSFTDSQELAKVANIYNVVGDDISGIEEATSSVISTMTAFDIQASDSISIVDKFNEVGKVWMPNGMVTYRKKVAISVKSQKWSRPRKDFVFVKY